MLTFINLYIFQLHYQNNNPLRNKKIIVKKLGIDNFIIGIGLMVCLAYFFPEVAEIEDPISLEQLASFGVSFIFFFYGLKLDFQKLKKDLSNWKMHVLIQASTFMLFPILILITYPLFYHTTFDELWLGIFYLAAIPSTVSSSVVMVSIAKGNVTSAIFNASISSLIGLIATPLWINIFIAGETGGFDVSEVMIKLLIQVIIPVTLGISFNKIGISWAEKHKNKLKLFDQSIILTIIYCSFSKSFSENIFQHISLFVIIALLAGLLSFFILFMYLLFTISKKLKFNREDSITVMFCGSKKSLVHGTVFSKILFPNTPILGILLLPLMIYHAMQLIAISFIAQKLAKQV